ncbi:MAG: MerR family transcriptional regulator [Elusimicrobia bacterium]|nr:MerR family transcriptional regulator [Elusimicrobiota bacterium]MBI2915738.1 MerR family transcriptional regulator [Elusimicrobiota bacterium]MBI3012213.1 MerR family transcriptional regulator [Elusimicrobiota bacterium]MBI4217690.1 MerR family transcriptional regulator [Elusimicrobiota bacterium]
MELADKEYFSIGETCQITKVKPYVLRYWETEFNVLRPSRRESGHRKYSRKDIENILKVKDLLHIQGFTILGAKKHLVQENRRVQEDLKMDLQGNSAAVEALKETQETLQEILKILK